MDGKLLYVGYELSDNLLIDLYGEPASEDGGYEVTGATLKGSKIDLAYFFSRDQLNQLSDWLDRHMKPGTLEVLAERAELDRALREFDRVWSASWAR